MRLRLRVGHVHCGTPTQILRACGVRITDRRRLVGATASQTITLLTNSFLNTNLTHQGEEFHQSKTTREALRVTETIAAGRRVGMDCEQRIARSTASKLSPNWCVAKLSQTLVIPDSNNNAEKLAIGHHKTTNCAR
uniref:Uncharacterized protein n=1 Tax=Physcomitrium patens TaxID=3218 RepID=A0A2K1IVP0_PHYPA|nr:hypothetical protein PHYPA_025286 [Physcomitrium patens]